MIDLSKDQKIILKNLFEQKKFSEFELAIENLGNFEDLPQFLIMGYAGSKVNNPESTKKDFLKSAILFEKIYSKNQSNLEALYNLIISSIKAETSELVINHLDKRYQVDDSDPKIIEGLARIHLFLGNMDLAVFYFKKLIKLNSKSIIDGGRLSLLASMNYPSGINQEEYYKTCHDLNYQFRNYQKAEEFNANYTNKKIKIGFLSGDLRKHSINFFLRDLINKIDKKKFEIIAFSNLEVSRHDGVTGYYIKNFDEWYDVFGQPDNELTRLVRSKNLDFLIDLSGFTFENRINILAARCAKIQISWMGYNNSIGIDNMDYLFTDPHLIKKNEINLYKEKLLFLPNIWNAMSTPDLMPEVNNLPFKKNKIFRFGSFNNFKKISNQVVEVWSDILNLGDCEIYLKNSGGYNKDIYDNLINKFKKKKVNLKKIIFLKRASENEFLKDYNKIDVALDTFPYPGVTTSFQSYLMGVPVLTMKGFNFNSRCGESINKNLGMNKFIAENSQDYINKAISLLKNDKLSNLRTSLRKKALNSKLFDTEKFTKNFCDILLDLLKSY